MATESQTDTESTERTHVRQQRSERLLATLAPFARVVAVSHVNPDPDALASMLGLRSLLAHRQPGKPFIMTVDGMIARAENRVMVESIPIPLEPVESVPITPGTALVMVDTQPHTGRRASEAVMPHVVIDHHETGGVLTGVLFRDIRPNLGATSTMVTGYLLEQGRHGRPPLATALLYGIESESAGYPARGGADRRRRTGLALSPRRQGPAGQDPQPQASPEPLRHRPARAGQRLPLPGRGRELAGDGQPARYHRRAGRLLHPVRPGQLGADDRPVREPAQALDPGRSSRAATRARCSAR